MTKLSGDSTKTSNLFHPVEHEILAQFFNTKSLHPVKPHDLKEDAANKNAYIGLVKSADRVLEYYALENAVARLVLEGIQDRLPQWATRDKEGNVKFGRSVVPKTNRKLSFAPQCLFGINWANSGPGFSWPEEYYLAYVPLYDRFVVTASQDSPDVYGYTDIAIGHFEGVISDVISAAGEQIRNNWSEHPNPWEHFVWFVHGAVDEAKAQQWGWQVWGNGRTDDDYPQWLEDLDIENGWGIENEA
jgi:hypothetical protein